LFDGSAVAAVVDRGLSVIDVPPASYDLTNTAVDDLGYIAAM
jgi:hypothetical protein